jgi:hypothetical protein
VNLIQVMLAKGYAGEPATFLHQGFVGSNPARNGQNDATKIL